MNATLIKQLFTDQKDPDLTDAVQMAIQDDAFLNDLLEGLRVKSDVYRYNCFKTLLKVVETRPARVYPSWDTLVEMLGSANSYHRSIGMQIIAGLVQVDEKQKFDGICDPYFTLLDDESFITARQTAQNAGKIAAARPDLARQIAGRLLEIEKTHFSPERQELLKADCIQSLDMLPGDLPAQANITGFVAAQANSSSPKTKAAAKAYLKKHA